MFQINIQYVSDRDVQSEQCYLTCLVLQSLVLACKIISSPLLVEYHAKT